MTTGAPVPSFFNCVIPIEHTEQVENQIKITKPNLKENQYIRPKGSDIATGSKVLEKGQILHSAEIGLLCTVGHIT